MHTFVQVKAFLFWSFLCKVYLYWTFFHLSDTCLMSPPSRDANGFFIKDCQPLHSLHIIEFKVQDCGSLLHNMVSINLSIGDLAQQHFKNLTLAPGAFWEGKCPLSAGMCENITAVLDLGWKKSPRNIKDYWMWESKSALKLMLTTSIQLCEESKILHPRSAEFSVLK